MMRRWTLLWGLLAGLIPASTFSLGLGDIAVRSSLNQPLTAEIPLLSARPEDVENATIQIAPNEAFKRQGLDRPSFLSQLRFEALRKRDGTPYIRITSTKPIREPFVDFLLDIDWAKGRLQRRYTLLLDPPGHKVQTETVAAPGRAAEPRPRGQAQSAPEAPAPEAIAQRKGSYGPVGSTDTLWSIALRLRPDSSVSVYQTMLALLRANPGAFDKDNINALKAGQTLRVPSAEEMASMSHEEAFQDVQRQNRAWRESSRPIAQSPAGQPASPEKSAAGEGAGRASGPAAAASEQMRLKLVSPAAGQPGVAGQAMPGQAPAPTEQDLSALREELAVTSQELGSKRQENEQLRARVTQLESMVGSMERMITLKDEELAQLQNRLSTAETGQSAAKEVSASAPSPATSVPTTRSIKDSEIKSTSAVKPAEKASSQKTASEKASSEKIFSEKTGAAHVTVRGLESESLLDSVLSNPLLLGTGMAAVLLLLTTLWWISRKRSHRDMAAYMPGFEEDQEAAPASDLATSVAGDTGDRWRMPRKAAPAPALATGIALKQPAATPQPTRQAIFPGSVAPAAAAASTAGAIAVSAEPVGPQDEVPLFADLPANLGDDLLRDNRDFTSHTDLDELDFSMAPSVAGAPASLKIEEQAAPAANSIADDSNLSTEDQTATLAQPERLEEDPSLRSEPTPAHAAQESATAEWHWPEPTGDSAASKATSANEAGDLSDFTLSLGLEEQPVPEAMAGLWNEPSTPDAQETVQPTPSEEALEGSSALQTKLDLAKVYIDLGVFEDAGSLLQEVKELGDDTQKQEAEELLKKIA